MGRHERIATSDGIERVRRPAWRAMVVEIRTADTSSRTASHPGELHSWMKTSHPSRANSRR